MKTTYVHSSLDKQEAIVAIGSRIRSEQLAPKSTNQEQFDFKGEVNYLNGKFIIHRNKRFNAVGPIKGFNGTVASKGSGSIVELKPVYNLWFIIWTIGLLLAFTAALQFGWLGENKSQLVKNSVKMIALLVLGVYYGYRDTNKIVSDVARIINGQARMER